MCCVLSVLWVLWGLHGLCALCGLRISDILLRIVYLSGGGEKEICVVRCLKYFVFLRILSDFNSGEYVLGLKGFSKI